MLKIITKKRLNRLENRIIIQKQEIDNLKSKIKEFQILKEDVEDFCRNNGFRLVKHIKPKVKEVPFNGIQKMCWDWEITR